MAQPKILKTIFTKFLRRVIIIQAHHLRYLGLYGARSKE